MAQSIKNRKTKQNRWKAFTGALKTHRRRFGYLLTIAVLMQAPFAVAELKPPTSYVLAADGTTQLSLEQAGILKSDGRQWAMVLGKALFWDMQAGSDGNACASCHYAAGADLRIRNQLSPGLKDVAIDQDVGDTEFGNAAGNMPSGDPAGPNYTKSEDFPLHRLADKKDRNSAIISTTKDSIASQGAFASAFTQTRILARPDKCAQGGEVFQVGNLAVRQVEPRNTPTTINAAFFYSNFWDGRANNTFNGVGVFGMRDIQGDRNKRLIILENGAPKLGYLKIKNASLASQA